MLNTIVGHTFHVHFSEVSTDLPSSCVFWGRNVRGSDTVWKSLNIHRHYRYSKISNLCRFWFQVPYQAIIEALKFKSDRELFE